MTPRVRRLASAAAVALAFVVGTQAHPAKAATYAETLDDAARVIANDARSGAVPSLHLPPAPLAGPPRYSPSLDDWLQQALGHARRDANRSRRSRDLRAIASTLRGLATASEASSPYRPSVAVAPLVRKILADPMYDAVKTASPTKPPESLWERFWQWIGTLIDRIIQGIADVAQGAPIVGTVFAVALIALAVGGLALVAYRVIRMYARRTQPAPAEGIALEPTASLEQWRSRAAAAARSGSYAEAIALLFQTCLLLLDRRGGIAYDASRTAGEYRRLVRRKATRIADPFDALARAFILAVYARRPMDDRDWASAQAAYLGIEPALGHA